MAGTAKNGSLWHRGATPTHAARVAQADVRAIAQQWADTRPLMHPNCRETPAVPSSRPLTPSPPCSTGQHSQPSTDVVALPAVVKPVGQALQAGLGVVALPPGLYRPTAQGAQVAPP